MRLSGNNWEAWASQLLSCHYGPTGYQRVPDQDKGDAGIEGFSIADGHCYQAYGCEEPLTTKERYAAQRQKMTDDIKKFVDNRVVLHKIFGTVSITRWALFVPYYDSKNIVAHAATKTQEVLAANLPYVASNFRVVVVQEEDFPYARDKLLSVASDKLVVREKAATPEIVKEWADKHDVLTSTLDAKILKLPTITSDNARSNFRERVLRWYLEGQSVLEGLRQYPEVYELVMETKAHREAYLAKIFLNDGPRGQIVLDVVNEVHTDLQHQAKQINAMTAEKLAYEAVADWLLRCPLDF